MSASISIDNTSPLWTFSSPCNSSGSAWNFVQNLPGYYNNTEATTSVVGARATFIFQGTGIAYYGTMWAQGANATVYLDELSENITTVLTNGSTLQGIAIWSRSNLDPSTLHALTVEMTGGNTLDIDYAKILTPPPAVIPPTMPSPAPAAFPASSKWSCNFSNSSTGTPNTPNASGNNLSHTSHGSSRLPMIIGIAGAICAILAVAAVIFLRRRRRKSWRGRVQVLQDLKSESKSKHVLPDNDGYALTAPRVPGLKIDPWDPPPVFMTPEQRAEKRRELNAKLVLDISAVNKSRSTTTSLSPSPTKERIQVDAPATVAAAAIRPLPAVTASMIVLTGSDHHYTAVPKTSQDWDDDADDADEKEDDMDDAEEMYAAHSWEDGDSNEAENMDTPLIGSPLTSPVPSSRLSSSHGGNSSSLNSAVRAHSRAHRILRSVRSRKSSLGMGRRGSVAHHRSTGQTTTGTASTNFSIVATASSTPRTPSSSQSSTQGRMLGPGSSSVALIGNLAPLPVPSLVPPVISATRYLPSPLSTSPPTLSTGFGNQQEQATSSSPQESSSWFFGGQRKRNNARRPPMGPRTQTSGSDVLIEAPVGK